MFALNTANEVVHIKDALIKTNYYCANCKGILRVKNGKIKVKHFYHLSKDCGDGGESLVHRYWKEYFSKLKEFEGFKIIDARTEVKLLNNTYIPDIVLKTDNGNYLIIEICYKNPKTIEYLEKYKELSKLIRVYEIKVDFDKIIETKILYDKLELESLYNELEIAKNYLIDYSKNGGIIHIQDMGYIVGIDLKLRKDIKMEYRWSYNPEIKKRYKYAYKSSIILTKVKIYLKKYTRAYGELMTFPFYVNIYNERELINKVYNGKLGTIYIEKDINVDIYLLNKKYFLK